MKASKPCEVFEKSSLGSLSQHTYNRSQICYNFTKMSHVNFLVLIHVSKQNRKMNKSLNMHDA